MDASRSNKRRRLIASCQECHRRKEKCDRQRPCSKCVSRNVPDRCSYDDATRFQQVEFPYHAVQASPGNDIYGQSAFPQSPYEDNRTYEQSPTGVEVAPPDYVSIPPALENMAPAASNQNFEELIDPMLRDPGQINHSDYTTNGHDAQHRSNSSNGNEPNSELIDPSLAMAELKSKPEDMIDPFLTSSSTSQYYGTTTDPSLMSPRTSKDNKTAIDPSLTLPSNSNDNEAVIDPSLDRPPTNKDKETVVDPSLALPPTSKDNDGSTVPHHPESNVDKNAVKPDPNSSSEDKPSATAVDPAIDPDLNSGLESVPRTDKNGTSSSAAPLEAMNDEK